MAYCTVTDVKEYLGIKTAADDALLQSLIDKAQRYIDDYTGRVFEAAADTVRYFDAVEDVHKRVLLLDNDLAQVTEIKSGSTVLTLPADVIPEPRNVTPWNALKITCKNTWCFTDCPEDAIEITGRWAYSVTAPETIKFVCLRLASFYYRQKDAQIFDTVAEPAAGVITVPVGVPADVTRILDTYRRDWR